MPRKGNQKAQLVISLFGQSVDITNRMDKLPEKPTNKDYLLVYSYCYLEKGGHSALQLSTMRKPQL